MSDLISRSELIKALEEYKEEDWNKNLCTTLPNVVDDCIDFIENMPTAYDVDKVVEELEEVHKKFCNSVTCGGKSMCKDCDEYIMFKKNIEIIKAGRCI